MMLQCAIYVSLIGALAAGNPKTEEPGKSVILLTLPKLDWALEVGGTELIVQQKEISPDGRNARFLAVDRTTGILVSGFLEDRGRPATAEECRDFYFAKLKANPPTEEDIAQSKLGNMAVVEYIVREYAGGMMNQKHANAYLTKGNVWADIHLSKMEFKEKERELFNTILRSVKLTSRTSTEKVRVSYLVANQVALKLDIPASWVDETKLEPDNPQREVQMTPSPEGSSRVFISAFSPKKDMSHDERLAGIRKSLEEMGRAALPQAVEKTCDIRQFQGKFSAGYFFTLTDKAPKPNEFKYLTQGGYAVGRLNLVFTVLYNEKDSEVLKQALEIVGAAQGVTGISRKPSAP